MHWMDTWALTMCATGSGKWGKAGSGQWAQAIGSEEQPADTFDSLDVYLLDSKASVFVFYILLPSAAAVGK